MPTIEISKKDLEGVIGKKVSLEELKELLLVVKGEIESNQGDLIKIEVKDVNRPDLWSTTGIGRELRGELGKDRGLPRFIVNNSKYKVIVDEGLKNIRPLTVAAVVKDLNLTEEAIEQIISLQEKLSDNFGRERKEAAIGIYDSDKIHWPVNFRAAEPDKEKFIALELEKELTLKKILQVHEKGKKYGKLLDGKDKYPIFIDSKNEILSMPPIINSNTSGKVTKDTKNVFIEVSGFSFRFIIPSLLVLVSALSDRGAKIESVQIQYKNKKITTPDFSPKKMKVGIDYCNKILGENLSSKEIKKLLEKRRYKVESKGNNLEIEYPAYRQDIMDKRDIVEDIAISLGYNKIKPVIPMIYTLGEKELSSKYEDKAINMLVGLGFQEVATLTLTNKKDQFMKMRLKEEKSLELANPESNLYNILRKRITPSLLSFLEKNKKARYPQKIFEVGTCIDISNEEAKDKRKLSLVITHSNASYTESRQVLDYLANNLGSKIEIKEMDQEFFIDGRGAGVYKEKELIGFIGEIHPQVLNNFGLDTPVCVVEIDMGKLI